MMNEIMKKVSKKCKDTVVTEFLLWISLFLYYRRPIIHIKTICNAVKQYLSQNLFMQKYSFILNVCVCRIQLFEFLFVKLNFNSWKKQNWENSMFGVFWTVKCLAGLMLKWIRFWKLITLGWGNHLFIFVRLWDWLINCGN